MNPKNFLLAIPLASLLILTPAAVSAATTDAPEAPATTPTLDILATASSVEEERALFRELVKAQNIAEPDTSNPAVGYLPPGAMDASAVPDGPTSWWAEFSHFLATADLEGSLGEFSPDDQGD